MLESCTDLRKLFVAVVELLRLWWCCDAKQPVTIVTRAPKRGYPPLLYASRARADAADSCYVDGSARDGTRCGVGLYYADGHALNRAAAVDVAAAAGASNVAEVAAIFAALAAHPRRRPLRLFSDSATALRCVAAARSDGAPRGPAAGAAGPRARARLRGAPREPRRGADPRQVAARRRGQPRRRRARGDRRGAPGRRPRRARGLRWRGRQSCAPRDAGAPAPLPPETRAVGRKWPPGHRTVAACAAAAATEGSLNAVNRCLSL